MQRISLPLCQSGLTAKYHSVTWCHLIALRIFSERIIPLKESASRFGIVRTAPERIALALHTLIHGFDVPKMPTFIRSVF